LLRFITTEFDRADYTDGSAAATAAASATDGQHQTVTVAAAVAADVGAERSASNRREHVLSNHC